MNKILIIGLIILLLFGLAGCRTRGDSEFHKASMTPNYFLVNNY